MNVHRLRSEEAPVVAALIRRAFAEQPVRTDPPSGALRETGASVADVLAAGGGAGATMSGAIVGVVLWNIAAGWLALGRLAVAPEWRGRGVARALIDASEAEGRRRGLPCLRLGVRLVLVGNRRLFASCGFRDVELTTHAGFDTPTSVTMEKRLAGEGAVPSADCCAQWRPIPGAPDIDLPGSKAGLSLRGPFQRSKRIVGTFGPLRPDPPKA